MTSVLPLMRDPRSECYRKFFVGFSLFQQLFALFAHRTDVNSVKQRNEEGLNGAYRYLLKQTRYPEDKEASSVIYDNPRKDGGKHYLDKIRVEMPPDESLFLFL